MSYKHLINFQILTLSSALVLLAINGTACARPGFSTALRPMTRACRPCHVRTNSLHTEFGATFAKNLGYTAPNKADLYAAFRATTLEENLEGNATYHDWITAMKWQNPGSDSIPLKLKARPRALSDKGLWSIAPPVRDFRAFVTLVAAPRTPDGKHPSFWRRVSRPNDVEVFDNLIVEEARAEFRRLGLTLAPALADAIVGSDESLASCAVHSLQHTDEKVKFAVLDHLLPRLKAGLDNEDPLVRREICRALSQLQAVTKNGVDQLVASLNDEHALVRAEAARGLSNRELGIPSLKNIVAHLDDSEWLVRYRLLVALQQSKKSIKFIEAIAAALCDDEWPVRHRAAAVLCQFGTPALRYVDQISEIIANDKNLWLGDEATAVLISDVDSDTSGRLLDSKHKFVVLAAIRHPTNSDHIQKIARILSGNRPYTVRLAAAQVLAAQDKLPTQTTDALVSLIRDDSLPIHLVQEIAIRIGLPAIDAVLPLTAAPSKKERERAIVALRPLVAKNSMLHRQLQQRFLLETVSDVRVQLITTLAPLESSDSQTLKVAVSEKSASVRIATFKALSTENDHAGWLPFLKAALKRESEALPACECIAVIGRIEPRLAARLCLDYLKLSREPDELLVYLELLSSLGSQASSRVTDVLRLLESDDARVRIAVLDTLGNIGSSEDEVVLALRKALTDSTTARVKHRNVQVYEAAASACTKLGTPVCRQCIQELTKLLRVDRANSVISAVAMADDAAGVTALIKHAVYEQRWSDDQPAKQALLQLAPRSVPILVDIMKLGASDEVRVVICDILGASQAHSKIAIKNLIALLSDNSLTVRRAAFEALQARARPAIGSLLIEQFDKMSIAGKCATLELLGKPNVFSREGVQLMFAMLDYKPTPNCLHCLELVRAGRNGATKPESNRLMRQHMDHCKWCRERLQNDTILGERGRAKSIMNPDRFKIVPLGVRLSALRSLREIISTSDNAEYSLSLEQRSNLWKSTLLVRKKAKRPNASASDYTSALVEALFDADELLRQEARDAVLFLHSQNLWRTKFKLDFNKTITAEAAEVAVLSGAQRNLVDRLIAIGDLSVRKRTISALVARGDVKTIVGIAKEGHQQLQLLALEALADLPPSSESLEFVGSILAGDAPPPILKAAADCIWAFGTAASEYRGLLQGKVLSNDTNVFVRASCIGALSMMEKPTVDEIATFRNLLEAETSHTLLRVAAAEALACCGRRARKTTLVLVTVLSDADQPAELRSAVAFALREVDPSPELAAPALMAATKDKDRAVAHNAYGAIGAMGKFAIPYLIKAGEHRLDRSDGNRACAQRQVSNDNWAHPWGGMQKRSSMPQFGMIPRFSDVESFSLANYFGDAATLGDIHNYLIDDLRYRALPYPRRTFLFRDGFVIVTQCERFDPESNLPDDKHRWKYGKVSPKLSAGQLIWNFLFGQPGHFRSFAFFVTTGGIHSEKGIVWSDSLSWGQRGDTTVKLSKAVAGHLARDYQCHAVLYQFESKDGQFHELKVPADPAAFTQFMQNRVITDLLGFRDGK